MRRDDYSPPPHGASAYVERLFGRAVIGLAAQEWLLGAYLVVLAGSVLAGDGPGRERALAYLAADLAVFAIAVWLSRKNLAHHPRIARVIHRCGILVPVLGSFLQLHLILPAASTSLVD